jgi:hypothetical protein
VRCIRIELKSGSHRKPLLRCAKDVGKYGCSSTAPETPDLRGGTVMKTLPVLIAIAACSVVHAEPPASLPPADLITLPAFETLDRDANGRLTALEAKVDPALADSFASLDKTSRGFITKKQYDNYTQQVRSAQVAKL